MEIADYTSFYSMHVCVHACVCIRYGRMIVTIIVTIIATAIIIIVLSMPRILRHCRVPIMGIRRRPEFFLLWIIMRRKAQRKDSFYLVETNEKNRKKIIKVTLPGEATPTSSLFLR